MSRNNSTMITLSRERGQHLKFEDRVSIKIYRKLKYTLRAIADVLDCSPSTIMYEIKRGTGERNGSRGRFPEYNPSRGQANYEVNRSRCHRKAKALNGNPFVDWVITPFNLPEALLRCHKKKLIRNNKRIYGTSITERLEEISAKIEEGHWEIDTVVGKRAGKESVVLTLVEKKTDYYIAIKIPGKDAASVMIAMEVLREEYGDKFFSKVFKSITADNGSEFSRLSELEAYGVSIYFAHPYSSWERAQNERHNRILRRYIPKGVSIDLYSAEQILHFADEMNALPRKQLGYRMPEELFEKFLDKVYSLKNIQVAKFRILFNLLLQFTFMIHWKFYWII